MFSEYVKNETGTDVKFEFKYYNCEYDFFNPFNGKISLGFEIVKPLKVYDIKKKAYWNFKDSSKFVFIDISEPPDYERAVELTIN